MFKKMCCYYALRAYSLESSLGSGKRKQDFLVWSGLRFLKLEHSSVSAGIRIEHSQIQPLGLIKSGCLRLRICGINGFFGKNNIFLVFRCSKHTSYKQEEFAQKQSKDQFLHQTKMTFHKQGFLYSFAFLTVGHVIFPFYFWVGIADSCDNHSI